MSNRQSSRKRNKHPELVTRTHELHRSELVDIYRANAMRTIRDIRKGIVNEEDIDKLQNFVQTAIALMQKVSVETFRQAQRNAELIGFLRDTDSSVVLDPSKQALLGEPVVNLSQLLTDVAVQSEIKREVNEVPWAELDATIVEVQAAIIVEKALNEVFVTPHVEPKDE